QPKAPPGDYRVTISEVGPATEVLRERVTASRIFERGMAISSGRGKAAMLQAIAAYEESLPHWRAGDDPLSEANVLYSMRVCYGGLGDSKKGLDYATQSLPIAQSTHDPEREGWALEVLGSIYNAFGDRRKAVEYFDQALPLMRKAGTPSGEASALNDLGMAHA